MRKLMTFVVAALLVSLPLLAQTTGTATTSNLGYYGDHDGDGTPNYKDTDYLNQYKPNWSSQTSTNSTSNTCPGNGRGYGDGTKPRPKNGTGFGAKAGQRMGKGHGHNKGRSNGQRKCLRDGSCVNTQNPSVQNSLPINLGQGQGRDLGRGHGRGRRR